LDSDDVSFPHKVEEMVKYYLQVIPQNPDVLIFHRLERIWFSITTLWLCLKIVLGIKKEPRLTKKRSYSQQQKRCSQSRILSGKHQRKARQKNNKPWVSFFDGVMSND
jgi:hypothetical protein